MTSQLQKVTVIIPGYNHAYFLPQRIESVLRQTYQNLEIILMDDCSSDNSCEVMTAYAVQDNRIRTLFNEQNSGSTFKQWNKGIEQAKGKYIWIAESDDFADERLLETLVTILEVNPTIGLAYANSQIVNQESHLLENWAWLYDGFETNLWEHDFIMSGQELLSQYMIYRNIIPNASAVVLRREVLQQVGPADDSFRVNGDWGFWAKIMSVCDVAFVAQRLNYFRHHTNNVRSATLLNGTALLERVRLVSIILKLTVPEPYFLNKMLNALIGEWITAIIEYEVPLSTHRKIYRGMLELEKNFSSRLRREFARRMMTNKMSGLRQLLGDGILYRILKRKR